MGCKGLLGPRSFEEVGDTRGELEAVSLEPFGRVTQVVVG